MAVTQSSSHFGVGCVGESSTVDDDERRERRETRKGTEKGVFPRVCGVVSLSPLISRLSLFRCQPVRSQLLRRRYWDRRRSFSMTRRALTLGSPAASSRRSEMRSSPSAWAASATGTAAAPSPAGVASAACPPSLWPRPLPDRSLRWARARRCGDLLISTRKKLLGRAYSSDRKSVV